MASKYDAYWAGRLRAIGAAVRLAATGVPATLDVRELRSLGARQSWYGTVEIRGREATGASMAHAVSLGKIVAASGVCTPWPESTFRFTVTQAGTLRIVMAASAIRSLAPRDPHHARRSDIAADAPGHSAGSEDGDPLDPATACARIHAALALLPPRKEPTTIRFTNGLYFFYEQGEHSPHAPGGRVVRIGNHPRAQDRLVGRLNDHFNSRPGAKNFSVFRRYLGGAQLRRENLDNPCLQPAPGHGHWEKQDGRPCPRCADVELAISQLLSSAFTFRCVRIDNLAERNILEKRLIATMAACPVCQPSETWLGHHAYPKLVRSSGLWNVQYVGERPMTGRQLRRFEEMTSMTANADPQTHPDLSHTLLVIPCSGGKDPVADPGLPQVSIADLLGTPERQLLEQDRQLAFHRPGTTLNLSSPRRLHSPTTAASPMPRKGSATRSSRPSATDCSASLSRRATVYCGLRNQSTATTPRWHRPGPYGPSGYPQSWRNTYADSTSTAASSCSPGSTRSVYRNSPPSSSEWCPHSPGAAIPVPQCEWCPRASAPNYPTYLRHSWLSPSAARPLSTAKCRSPTCPPRGRTPPRTGHLRA